MEKNRYIFLDQLRGIAIVLMITFHFCFDLNYFLFIQIDFIHNPFWIFFQRLIVFIFLTCVGISLAVVHQKKIKFQKALIRFAILVGWSVALSATTYFIFPRNGIYFGVIHCIALSSLVAFLFLRIPMIAGGVGVTLLILDLFFGIGLPWIKLSHTALDYCPFFPWFGAVLFGIFLHRVNFHTLNINVLSTSWLVYLGKHSLAIYFIHQPVLFGFIGTAWWLKSNYPL